MMTSTVKKDPSGKKSGNAVEIVVDRRTVVASVAIILFSLVLKRQYSYSGDPIIHMIPNMLLFTPFRGLLQKTWKLVLKYDSVKKEPTPLPEMPASEYTYEKMRELTDDWRSPAIVRDLFAGTPGVENWPKPGYLSNSVLADFIVPVIVDANYGTDQKTRELQRFGDAVDEVVSNKDSNRYLFFPVKSRAHWNHSNVGNSEELTKAVDTLLENDLELDRIFKGFGGPEHRKGKVYHGGQFIAGQGRAELANTTGSFWHCAGGNNWFVQVVGKKRWYFMDQKYSSYMQPVRDGMYTIQTGAEDIYELQNYLPVKFADVRAGDLLYNPDWEWHTIQNYEGLSIGCPLREFKPKIMFRNNFQLSSQLIFNKILEKFGFGFFGD